MGMREDSRLTALRVVTGCVLFTARWPGHKPWLLGWEAILGGVLIHFVAVALFQLLLWAGLRFLRPKVFPDQGSTGQELEDLGPVACVSLLIVAAWMLVADAGVLGALGDSGPEGY